MLEFKDTLREGGIKEVKILIVEIRKSRKLIHSISKKNQRLRKIIVMGLFNPEFIKHLQEILRTKRFRSALYNICFQFGLG